MEAPPTPDPSAGPRGPLSGEQGPSGPLSGEQGPSGPLSGDDQLTRRLADVEIRLDQVSERLEGLEASLRAAVAQEVEGGMAGLRRAITELGRRLVQDLPHELARHRDAIVAELRPPPPPPPPPQPMDLEEPDEEGEADVVDDAPDRPVATVLDRPEERRRRRASRRRPRRE